MLNKIQTYIEGSTMTAKNMKLGMVFGALCVAGNVFAADKPSADASKPKAEATKAEKVAEPKWMKIFVKASAEEISKRQAAVVKAEAAAKDAKEKVTKLPATATDADKKAATEASTAADTDLSKAKAAVTEVQQSAPTGSWANVKSVVWGDVTTTVMGRVCRVLVAASATYGAYKAGRAIYEFAFGDSSDDEDQE
jgi:hypothetical protein